MHNNLNPEQRDAEIRAEVSHLKYKDFRPNVVRAFDMLMYDADVVTQDQSSWWNFGKKIATVLATLPWQAQMAWDLSYLKAAIEKDTGLGVMQIFGSTDGLIKLLGSETFASLLQDQEIWNKIDPKKATTIAKRYKDVFKGFGIPEESIDTFVPSTLIILKELSKKLSENKKEVAAFMEKHKAVFATPKAGEDREITHEFIRDGIALGRKLNIGEIILSKDGKKLRPEFKPVLAGFLPIVAQQLEEIIRIYIPTASALDLINKLEDKLPTLFESISKVIPMMFSRDSLDQNDAMTVIIFNALQQDIKALSEEDIMKYLEDLNKSINKLEKPIVENIDYVASYVSTPERREVLKNAVIKLLPDLSTLDSEILSLYDYGMAINATKEQTKAMLKGAIVIAKKLDDKTLEMAIEVELERQLHKYDFDKIVPVELQKELRPFILKVARDGLKTEEVNKLPGYLSDVMFGKISTSEMTFDTIDWLATKLAADVETNKAFRAFITKPNNQVLVTDTLNKLFERSPLIRGHQGDKIVAIIADPKKFEVIQQIYGEYKKGNKIKAGLNAFKEILPSWGDNDLRALVVHVVLNYIHSMIYEIVYPSFMRRRTFGKFADEILQEATKQVTANAEKVDLSDIMKKIDTGGEFSKEHFAFTGSFKGLEIKVPLDSFIVSELSFAGATFKGDTISNCDFKNSNFTRAKFEAGVKISGNTFDIKSLESLVTSLALSKNTPALSNNKIVLEQGGEIEVNGKEIKMTKVSSMTEDEAKHLNKLLKSGMFDVTSIQEFHKITKSNLLGVPVTPPKGSQIEAARSA